LSQSDGKGGLILHKEMIFNHHDCKMGVFKTFVENPKESKRNNNIWRLILHKEIIFNP